MSPFEITILVVAEMALERKSCMENAFPHMPIGKRASAKMTWHRTTVYIDL